MKFNFFFISYTMIYAKYNHCYEIPRDMPIRYFDGTGWKIMKPRHNFRTKAPRDTYMSTELDWVDLIKEMNEIELHESKTQISPTETTTTKKTTKQIIFKMTAPKFIKRKNHPLCKPTSTIRADVKCSTPRCKLKLKTSPTTTIDPRIWQKKTITSEDWRNAWTRVRPTKKLCPVGENFLVGPSHCKLTSETSTKIDSESWKKKMITSEDWLNIWTREKTSAIAMKKYTTKSLPVTSTKKCVTKNKKPMTTTEKPDKFSGTQGDDGNGAENWSNLMKEFLKYVDAKKCPPPCATTILPFSGYKLGGKRLGADTDDLMTILMDGVEIDDKLSEVNDDTLQGTAIMRFKETYEADREHKLNFDSEEDSVSRDLKINNNDVQDLDLQSFNDSVQVRRIKKGDEAAKYRKKNVFLKQLKSKNYQDYEAPRVSQSEENTDEIKVKNEAEEDEVLHDSEINSYLDVLKDKHNKKEKYAETIAYLDAENVGYTRQAHDKDIRPSLDEITDINTQKYKENSQYLSKEPINFRERNRIADYVTTKRIYFTDSTEIADDNEDFLQDRDMTFDLGTLEGDHEKADKYSTESIEKRDDVDAYTDAVQEINEQKDDETIKNYELNENITN